MGSKVLYLECKSGAAGDMLMGALYGVMNEEQKAYLVDTLNQISDKITVTPRPKKLNGISGIHMEVCIEGQEEDDHVHGHTHEHEHDHDGHTHEHEHEHEHDHDGHTHEHDHDGHTHEHVHDHRHVSYEEIVQKIGEADVPERVREDALAIYRKLGEAESKVHGVRIEQIHFHEVGTLDAVADVLGNCLAIHILQPDKIICSPVCVGNGMVHCAHGWLPVPAPATAELIKGMEIYTSPFEAELLTPTGAAILSHFVQEYSRNVSMNVQNIGYGAGTRVFPQAGFVRAFLGEEVQPI